VESAWEYDAAGNVVRTWSGSPDFATGVERYEIAYDNPIEPTRTTVTIHRGATEREVVTYTLSRTAANVGAKARVTSISGDCSSCGLGPNSQLSYDDPVNPLLPTRVVDGRGLQTLFGYDAHGRVLTKTEAAGTPSAGRPPGPTMPHSRPSRPASRRPRRREERAAEPPCSPTTPPAI
jgi:YD repeat-containing protein